MLLDKEHVKKILIINPFGIGDVLFSTPLIRNLKEWNPDVQIYYLCNKRVAPLLREQPFIYKIFVYERDDFERDREKSFSLWLKSMLTFLNGIRGEHIDVSFDLSLNTKFSFFSWYAGIKKRVGLNYKNRGVFLTHKVDIDGFSRVESITSTIDLTQDLDTLWNNTKRDSCRRFINRAQRQAIEIKINEGYDELHEISESFRRSKGFRALFGVTAMGLEEMKQYGTLFTAKYEGRIIAGQLYLEDESCIKLMTSASRRFEVDHKTAKVIGDANHLMHWEVIKYAKNKGIKTFDFGGLFPIAEAEKDAKKNSINVFKLRFGGDIVTRYTYYKFYTSYCRIAYSLFKTANRFYRRKEIE